MRVNIIKDDNDYKKFSVENVQQMCNMGMLMIVIVAKRVVTTCASCF